MMIQETHKKQQDTWLYISIRKYKNLFKELEIY